MNSPTRISKLNIVTMLAILFFVACTLQYRQPEPPKSIRKLNLQQERVLIMNFPNHFNRVGFVLLLEKITRQLPV